jgi:membrane protein required for colicin V production
MSLVDVSLVVLLTLFALRGYWRGFFRESFGFVALILGIAAALRFASLGEVVVLRYVRLPPPVPGGVAFVAIFVGVYTLVTLIGVFLDWGAGASILRPANGIIGAAFGIGKGAVVLGFLLLFVHLFPFASRFDAQLMQSSIARPLVSTASTLIRVGTRTTSSQTVDGQT